MDKWFAFFIGLVVFLLVGLLLLPVVWYYKILIGFVIYVLLIFVVSRLLVFSLGFWRTKIPAKLPKSLERNISEVKREKSQLAALKKAYEIITERFYGKELETFTQMSRMMLHDVNKIWNNKGLAQCCIQCYFLRVLLVRSGHFTESQIRRIHGLSLFNIHQILTVKLKKGWIVIDPWAKFKDIPLGRKFDGWNQGKYHEKNYHGIYRIKGSFFYPALTYWVYFKK